MRKLFIILMCTSLLLILTGCITKVSDDVLNLWQNSYSDSYNLIDENTIRDVKLYYDGNYTTDLSQKINARKDMKYEFLTDDKIRFVNSPDGYAITFPSKDVIFDYSLSKYRIQAKFNNTILTISYEHSNPYGDTKGGWETYKNEWLIRYINNPIYLEDNNLSYSSKVTTSKDIIEGYEVTTYPIFIEDSSEITHPYYNISIVRKPKEYVDFYLFVSKSTIDNTAEHLELLKSFTTFKSEGVSSNHLGSLERKENPLWNSETKAYYNYLLDEETFDFGFFRYSLPDDTDTEYRDKYIKGAQDEIKWTKENMDYDVEVLPTYNHLGWYDEDTYFPSYAANTLAGGNGFNSKPVFQFTLQYTRNNNNVSIYNTTSNYTPMFDILRGEYDEFFETLATQIKEYEKPILFRLNNEMNTDWTSYSGIISLLDPDIFRLTWIRLYDIFNKVGVDNCIWIFNPIAKSCPYSSWGEDMCYMPGVDYVQALGITYYEMFNTDTYISFIQSYSGDIYEKNKVTWANYPWVISEFGCGSGGNDTGEELFRNQDKQAMWVSEMLNCFANKSDYEFVSKISVAVWFNCNDVTGDNLIINALNIDPSLTNTISAFKEGFKKIKENDNK